MARGNIIAAMVGVGLLAGFGGGISEAGEGLYGHDDRRLVAYHHRGPREGGGPNEDSFVVEQDDRRVVACYDATYYPAKYRVDPQGHYVGGPSYRMTRDGNRWAKHRRAPVYLETRTRIKEDYVSLRPTDC